MKSLMDFLGTFPRPVFDSSGSSGGGSSSSSGGSSSSSRSSSSSNRTPPPQNYSVTDDIKMGLGLMERTPEYNARTARTVAQIASNKKPKDRTAADRLKIANAAAVAAAAAAPTPAAAPNLDDLSFGDAFNQERAKQGDGGVFTYQGRDYNTNLAPEASPLAPETSPIPQARPAPAAPVSYDAFGTPYSTPEEAARADVLGNASAAAANEAFTAANNAQYDPRGIDQRNPRPPRALIPRATLLDEGNMVDGYPGYGYGPELADQVVRPESRISQGVDTETFPTVGTTVPLDEILTPGEIAAREFQREIAEREFQREDYTPTGAELLAQLAANGQTDMRNNGNGATYDGTGLNPDTEDGLNSAVTNYGDRVIPGELAARGPVPNTGSRGSESLNIQAVPDPVPSRQATNPRLGYESGQDVLQASPDYLTGLDGSGPNTVGQVDDTYYGGGPGTISPGAAVQTIQNENPNAILDGLKNFAIGVPENASQMVGGLADYIGSSPVNYTGGMNILNLLGEVAQRTTDPGGQNILTRAPGQVNDVSGLRGVSDSLQRGADNLTNYFYPEGNNAEAVITGTMPSELGIQDVNAAGGYQGVSNVVMNETGGGALDVIGSMVPPLRVASAFANAGEQISGTRATAEAAVNQMVASGEISYLNNKAFRDALNATNGDVEAAKRNIVDTVIYTTGPQTAAIGSLDAAIPGPGKGLLKTAGNMAVRSGLEGGQEVAEQGIALNGLNSVLGLTGDGKQQIFQDASGNFVMGALAGGSTSATVGPLAALGAGRNRDEFRRGSQFDTPVQQPGPANQGMNPADQAMYGGMDTSGIKPGFAPRRQPAPAGPAQTIDGTVNVAQPQGPNPNLNQGPPAIAAPVVQGYNPNLNQTAGSLATSSGVRTAYEDSQDPRGPDQRNTPTTSLDAMGAAEIIKNEIETTGALSQEVAINLSKATGLEMVDIEAIAQDVVPGIGIDPLLMDERRFDRGTEGTRTDFGGSNIKVTQNSDGSKTLTNLSTGDPRHIARVEKGQDVSDAVAKFDEITTGNPTGSATVDTNAIKVNSEGVASLATDGTKILKLGEDGRLMDRGNPFTGVQQGTTYVDGVATTGTGTEVAVVDTASTDVAVDTAAEAAAAAAAETGTDVTVANPVDLVGDTTVNADGTTDVVIDGTTDLTTDGTTDVVIDGTTDLTTDTNLNTDLDTVVEVDDALEGEFTVNTDKDLLTNQTKTTDTTKTKKTIVPIVDPNVQVLTEVGEFPEEDTIVEIEDDPVGDPPPDAPIEPPLPIMETNSNGETVYSCAEPFVLSYNGDGDPICALSKTTTKKVGRKRNRFGGSYSSGLASTNRRGRSQLRGVKETTTKEYSDPISTRS